VVDLSLKPSPGDYQYDFSYRILEILQGFVLIEKLHAGNMLRKDKPIANL
jgi:hypothetical protein